jgi:hypothetical protein
MELKSGMGEWNLWLQWIWNNAAGTIAAGVITGAGLAAFVSEFTPEPGVSESYLGVGHAIDLLLLSTLFVTQLIGGAVIGKLQQKILRQQIAELNSWVLATSAGMAIGNTAGVVVGVVVSKNLIQSPTDSAVISGGLDYGVFAALIAISAASIAILGGFSVGFLQWLSLRRHVPRAGWWILANIAGPLACIAFTAMAIWLGNHIKIFESIWGWLAVVGGVLVINGAITGAVLAWLTRGSVRSHTVEDELGF